MSKSNPIYIVYETTNNVNGKYYIGVHKQKSLKFDGYLGSGIILANSIKKHNPSNFFRETLYICNSMEEAYLIEQKIVNRDLVSRKTNYNLKIGGKGGISGLIHSEKTKLKMSLSKKGKPGVKRTAKHKKEISKALKDTVPVKDKNGNQFRISVNDQRWIDGDVSHISKGTKLSKQACINIGKASKGRKWSEEAKLRQKPSHRKGKKLTKETINKMSKSRIGVKHKQIICPHCSLIGGQNAMKRYHFDNCKFKV